MAEPNDEITTRRQRLEHIRARDIDPYPSTVRRTHTIAEVIENFERILEQKETVTIAGRILSLRPHGGSTFANISDGTGTIQLYVKADEIGEDSYQKLEDIDIADFVSCVGNLFLTKRGEKTLLLNAAPTVISKALRPLPEKWHGLSDIEQRYRKRYLDLIANPKAKEIVYLRAKLLRELRTFLDGKGYLEVDTPILQSIPGGANARPFVTHHNTLNVDLYLRIAPELYLKQLLVGGIPKVYEIARCFRNEGMDPTHNPEFTQIEMYAAYENYEDYMRMVEELLSAVVPAICGSLIVSVDGQSIDFTPPYKRVDWNETLNAALGEKTQNLSDDNLRKLLKKKGVDAEPSDGRGTLLDHAYKKLVRPHIVAPTFFINHPLSLSPLSKTRTDKKDEVERFQLVVAGGIEMMNGFSELNDPDDQRRRFEEQEKLRRAGDEEAQRIDESYLEAMEHGMPPAAGIGIGIDRLLTILTDSASIKEVILFPTLRPKDSK